MGKPRKSAQPRAADRLDAVLGAVRRMPGFGNTPVGRCRYWVARSQLPRDNCMATVNRERPYLVASDSQETQMAASRNADAAIRIYMVGATGFEPATSCSRSRRATGLRYAPPIIRTHLLLDAPGRTRTSNLLIRSQMLYPIELRAPTQRVHGNGRVRSHEPADETRARTETKNIFAWRGPVKAQQPGDRSHCACGCAAVPCATASTPRAARSRASRHPPYPPYDDNKKAPRQCRGAMGGTRLELVTSTMSTWRSNQLS
jgi:hypothetical protein